MANGNTLSRGVFLKNKNEMFGGTIRFKKLMEKTYACLKEISALTSKMIDNSITALIDDNEVLYNQLKLDILKIRDLKVQLEKSIVNSVALHQPFAADLRFLISSLKVSNEIERTARDAVHIAHSSKFLDRSMDCLKDSVDKIGDLGKKALNMYKQSIEFFLNRKAVDSEEWIELDDEIDHLHIELIGKITEQMICNSSATRAGVSLILTTRYIERIADHACNVCEESIYVVTGKREAID